MNFISFMAEERRKHTPIRNPDARRVTIVPKTYNTMMNHVHHVEIDMDVCARKHTSKQHHLTENKDNGTQQT